MLISDIPVGGPISIEISIDNVSYEMPSSVVASKNGYILIAPFTSKGAVIDFSSYKDILFNLYTIDPATKNRVVWKNINIETITYKSTGFASAYYKISTNVFASIASECDRRFNQRISTEASGHISSDTTEADIPVTLIDVSDKGLSFSTSNELLYNYNNTSVSYTHLRAHETDSYLVCRLLLEKKKKVQKKHKEQKKKQKSLSLEYIPKTTRQVEGTYEVVC